MAPQIRVAAYVRFSTDKQVEPGLSVHWDPPRLYEIETVEGFSLEELPQALGWLKLNALGWVKHSDVPRGDV
jgi:hypothetical protein